MKLNFKQAYLAMINMLDAYYWETKCNDLGAMLGFMSINIFEGDEPTDPAVWITWKECIGNIIHGKTLSLEQAFQSSVAFLRFYNEQFGFDIKDVIETIIEASENDAKWIEGVNKALDPD